MRFLGVLWLSHTYGDKPGLLKSAKLIKISLANCLGQARSHLDYLLALKAFQVTIGIVLDRSDGQSGTHS